MKRVGAYLGKFYPPHIGHLWVVDSLVDGFDELYIIISKNDIRIQEIFEKDGFEILDAKLIKEWFKKHYKHNKKIKVEIFDETSLKPYPEDQDKWAEKFKKQFPFINVKIADESYRAYNQKYFPELEFLAIPRDVINIHSTQIRQDLKNNMKYLIPTAKKYFKNKEKNYEHRI